MTRKSAVEEVKEMWCHPTPETYVNYTPLTELYQVAMRHAERLDKAETEREKLIVALRGLWKASYYANAPTEMDVAENLLAASNAEAGCGGEKK